jgi:hypothetical protein
MVTFANDQLKKNKKSYVQSIWPAIKLDLDYVAQFWNAVRPFLIFHSYR